MCVWNNALAFALPTASTSRVVGFTAVKVASTHTLLLLFRPVSSLGLSLPWPPRYNRTCEAIGYRRKCGTYQQLSSAQTAYETFEATVRRRLPPTLGDTRYHTPLCDLKRFISPHAGRTGGVELTALGSSCRELSENTSFGGYIPVRRGVVEL